MATYDRDAIVEAVNALYQIILLMGDEPVSQLATPPPSWAPPVNTGKSAAVVDLMGHLPYYNGVYLAAETSAINYLSPNWTDGRWIPFDPYGITRVMNDDRPADITDAELALTMQNDNLGTILILDTKTGMVRIIATTMSQTECQVHGTNGCPHHLCRHAKGVQIRPILELLQEWRHKYLSLEWMVDYFGLPDVTGDDWHDEEMMDKMKSIYRAHGWPHQYRAQECRAALDNLRYSEGEDDDEDDNNDNKSENYEEQGD